MISECLLSGVIKLLILIDKFNVLHAPVIGFEYLLKST